MATIERHDAAITVPAAYLEDARDALVREIDSDSGALRTSNPADRTSAAVILQRDMRLLDALLDATGDTELTAEQDNVSSPLLHMLEEVVRLHVERLVDVAQYGPLPMGDVLELTERMRWAAQEAIRMEPAVDDRLTAGETRVSAAVA